MIRINQVKLRIPHTEEDLKNKVAKMLRVPMSRILTFRIVKQSMDARKKPELYYVYTIDLALADESIILKKNRGNQITKSPEQSYKFSVSGSQKLSHRPIVIGSGPAGLFCAYMLAHAGYKPLLLERGADVDTRTKDVAGFWENGVLNPESNVQFGEGGQARFLRKTEYTRKRSARKKYKST